MRNKPRIRFKGFTEDWEQRKLGDLLILLKDGSHGTHKNTDVGVYLLSAKNIKNGQINIMPDDRIISWEDYDVIHKNYELQFGDILLTIVGSIGETAIYNLKTKVTFQRSVAFLRPSSDLNNGFLYTLINTNRFQNQLQTKQVVSAQPGIYLGDLASIDITYPKNLSEQEKIYSIFKEIENFITLHQRKLEKLKLAKKALLQKLFPKNGSQFPEIRFKGFTDAWEQCKLGEIFEYLQNNTLSRDSLNYKNPNIKNIHYGDILVKFDEILDGSNKDIPYINSELDLSKFSKSLLQDGDIIFSDTAEDDTVGKAIELKNVNAPFILSGLHTIPCRPLIPFGKGYLGNFLNSDSYRVQLRPLVQGIKVSSISKSALKDTMIEYPKNLDEQEKIGSLFQNVAKMITLHQCKLDKLQDVKKGLLQKMFV